MSSNLGNIHPIPSLVTEFWESLKPTHYVVACPRCNAQDLEVRRAGRGRSSEHYIFHHSTCLRVYPTESKYDQVMRALVEDAQANTFRPNQSEHDLAREAEDAYTIALQDEMADAEFSTENDLVHAYSQVSMHMIW